MWKNTVSEMRNLWDSWIVRSYRRTHQNRNHLIQNEAHGRKKTEKSNKEYLDPRSWNLKKKVWRIWSQMITKENMPNHIIVKLLKTSDKEKKLEAIKDTRGKRMISGFIFRRWWKNISSMEKKIQWRYPLNMEMEFFRHTEAGSFYCQHICTTRNVIGSSSDGRKGYQMETCIYIKEWRVLEILNMWPIGQVFFPI